MMRHATAENVPRSRIISAFTDKTKEDIMEAEQLNSLEGLLADLTIRANELRRYL